MKFKTVRNIPFWSVWTHCVKR